MAAYQQAKIGGFCHIYIGQEAVAVGCTAAVNHDDPIVLAYRDHGHALARGMHPNACMAEMYGRLEGAAKGKGGSMHMFDKPNNLYGGHGIVGAQTPLGAGLAFATKYENEVVKQQLNTGTGKTPPSKKVALSFLGDGAINQGAFHEAKNLATVLELPVLFVLENNKYSMGTSIERGTASADDLRTKAEAYDMLYAEFDGMDVLSVYDNMKPLVDECREKQVPAFVNIHCYRYQGHSMSDPQKYRTKDEVAVFQDNDPVKLIADYCISEGHISADDHKQMQKDIKAIAKDAVAYAESLPPIDPAAELNTDVYANIQPNLSPSTTYHHGAPNPLIADDVK